MKARFFTALLALLPTVASAQAPQLTPGDRVWITLDRPPQEFPRDSLPPMYVGTLVAGSPDSIHLDIHPGMAPISVARTSVRRLRRSLGKRSRVQESLRMGGGMALAAGALWAVRAGLGGDTNGDEMSGPAMAVVFPLAGVVYGALWPSERWRRLPLETPVRVAPIPHSAR